MSTAKTPVVWDETAKKHRPLGTGEKVGGLAGDSLLSSDSGNLVQTGSDGLIYATGSGMSDPRPDNFLEASGSGRLQVTPERLTEWFDSHPSAAADFAAALRVVSGDSGNVIVTGSDSGAFLDSSALADALSGMSAANLQKLAAALADGRTITASGGRLTVDPSSATAAQLSKISTALRKSGGGLSVGSDGKLSVDFGAMSAATLSDLISSIIQDGGGLAVDDSGQIYVDFEEMDDTKFRKMMQGFIDKQTLKSTGGANHFYVDGSNGSDADPTDENPRTSIGAPSDPFKTIQHCVDYITQIYKFASTNAYIECKNVSVNKPLSLPSFDRTTAEITIRGASFDSSTARNSPTLKTDYSIEITNRPTSGLRHAVNCTGTGVWNLRNFYAVCYDEDLSGSGGHLSALHVGDYASVNILRCKFEVHRSSSAPWIYSSTTGEHVVFVTDYGHLDIGGFCHVIGSDLSSDPVTISSGDHAGTYNRKLNGICVGDHGLVRVNDTRNQTGDTPPGDDKRLVFSGGFHSMVSCTSFIARNLAFMGLADTSGVVNANYRFRIEYGGSARLTDSGKLDADHNDAAAEDTWLGTVSTNQDSTSRISHVQPSTFSWYD